MRKSGVLGLLAALLLSPAFASAATDDVDQGLGTLWEVLWHQSGTPTRLVRWDQDMRVRITGTNAAAHRDHTLQALRAVANEAGIKLVEVSGTETANVTVEITPDNQLEDNQPCVTYLNFATETRIDSASVQMRGKDAWRCAYHEAMHVMGVRGHPAGKTVLSYFPWKVDALLPLDKVMLRAWYSPRMRAGATPFEALPVLADELVASTADKTAAQQSRDRFLARVIDQMQTFANGQGDVPAIVKRSGKATDDGIRNGRMEMSYFLGVAYLEGSSVTQDAAQAVRWLQRAATLGSRTAHVTLGAAQARMSGSTR